MIYGERHHAKEREELRLRADVACTITHHGVERSGVRYVFLYLDRPQQLLHALGA